MGCVTRRFSGSFFAMVKACSRRWISKVEWPFLGCGLMMPSLMAYDCEMTPSFSIESASFCVTFPYALRRRNSCCQVSCSMLPLYFCIVV